MDHQRLAADVKASESCRLVAYRDTEGYWTVGWGHKCDGPCVWTQERADSELDTDLSTAEALAAKLTEWPFLDTAARQNAVVELVFNMGNSHWRMFAQTRFAICHHEWQAAHDGLLKSIWAGQVHETRANRLADYLLTGEFSAQ
jgi:GH24 family phage-related lysozyme (muramidase)